MQNILAARAAKMSRLFAVVLVLLACTAFVRADDLADAMENEARALAQGAIPGLDVRCAVRTSVSVHFHSCVHELQLIGCCCSPRSWATVLRSPLAVATTACKA